MNHGTMITHDYLHNVFNHQKVVRNWTKLYWAIDLHDTVISGTYNKLNGGSKLYKHAKEVLDFLYKSSDNVTQPH